MIHRDPAKYEPTTHFRQQIKYRDAPKPSRQIAAECIRDGDLKPAHKPYQVVFELERGVTTWRVVAEVNADAYTDENETHPLITIYAKDAHGHNQHGSAFDHA